MEVHELIVEFVFGTYCIITHWQVKPELPDSPELLHRDTTFSVGTPIYAKSTIASLPFGRYVPTLRSDTIFLTIGSIVRSNYLMLSFLKGNFYCAGRSKITTWRLFGSMRVHSPHQYLILAQIWYDTAHWWKVSRGCFKVWRFYKYRNVSWRSTTDLTGCWFKIPILILNNNQLQLVHGKGTKQRPLIYLSALYANERSFVPAWKVMEAN